MAGTWLLILDLAILTVGHLREKNARVSLRIECLLLLIWLLVVVGARTWVLTGWELLVLDIDGWLEDLTVLLGADEVSNRRPSLVSARIRVIEGGADSVVSAARVHVLIHLLGGD